MLVLTRTPNQTICVGDDIRVTVLSVRGDHVKIGVTAPTGVPIHREEYRATLEAQELSDVIKRRLRSRDND